MPQQIVECIPNFSEGRRPEVIAAIVAAIQTVPGTTLLDRSSDADHNRSVVTFVGTLEAVEEAAFQGIAKALSPSSKMAIDHLLRPLDEEIVN